MALLKICLFSLIVFAFSVSSQAEIYQWVDKSGKTQFSDTPPQKKYNQPAPEVTRLKAAPITQIQSVRPKEIERYQENNWKKREDDARKRKKQRRLDKERLAKEKRRNEKLCDNARKKYRQFMVKATGRTDLASLKSKRAKREKLKGKMDRYCR